MRFVSLLVSSACLAGATIAAPAGAATFSADYGIYLADIPLGEARASSSFTGDRYSLTVQGRLTGLAGALTSGKAAATASGAVSGGRVLPAAFAVTSRSSNDQRTVRMGLNGGNVAAVDIAPPLEEKLDRVPVADAHRRGVVDPVSALIMPITTSGAFDAENCNRTIPVFDGAARFNVVLSYVETRQVDKAGYRGPVLVCKARYRPISGHRPSRPAVQFMVDNDEMTVWLAPVESMRVLVPLRIAVKTMIGMSVVEASRFAVDKSVTAAVPKPDRAKN